VAVILSSSANRSLQSHNLSDHLHFRDSRALALPRAHQHALCVVSKHHYRNRLDQPVYIWHFYNALACLAFQNAACLSRDVIIMMVRDVKSMMVPEFIIMMAYDIMPDMEWEDVLASTPLLEVSTSFSFLMKMFLIFLQLMFINAAHAL